jgi:hypothetical protein
MKICVFEFVESAAKYVNETELKEPLIICILIACHARHFSYILSFAGNCVSLATIFSGVLRQTPPSPVAEMCLIERSNQPPPGGFRPEEGFPRTTRVTLTKCS